MKSGAVAVIALVGVVVPNVTAYMSSWVAPPHTTGAGIRRLSYSQRSLARCRAQSSVAIESGGGGDSDGVERVAKPPLKVTRGVRGGLTLFFEPIIVQSQYFLLQCASELTTFDGDCCAGIIDLQQEGAPPHPNNSMGRAQRNTHYFSIWRAAGM